MISRWVAAAAAVAAVLSAPSAQAQGFINVLTGGTSGVYYPLGVAIGKIFTDKIPNVKTQVQATKASVENLILLQQGRGEIAFTLGDSLKAAWEGDEEAGFKSRLDKLRTIGAIYPNYIQIVATADSGIKTLADLRGKSLSVGAPKSGTELNSRAILAAAGLSYKDLGKVEYLPFAESVDLMKNRQLDATLQSAGLGVASLKDLSTSIDIVVVAVPKDVVGSYAPYLQENMTVKLSMHDVNPVAITLPQRTTLEVVETEPVTKGQTASSSYKPAIPKNGVRTNVPPHIGVGTRIVVMTEDGSYVERAKD